MDTRERVARDIRNKWGWGPERIADSVCNIFDEERAELVKALMSIRERLVGDGSIWRAVDEIDAALAKATGK